MADNGKHVDLEVSLRTILGQIQQDRFGGRQAPLVTISEGTGCDADGRLQGAIEIHILRRNGEMAPLHVQPLINVSSERELKDMFAEALSKVLANHTDWPR